MVLKLLDLCEQKNYCKGKSVIWYVFCNKHSINSVYVKENVPKIQMTRYTGEKKTKVHVTIHECE